MKFCCSFFISLFKLECSLYLYLLVVCFYYSILTCFFYCIRLTLFYTILITYTTGVLVYVVLTFLIATLRASTLIYAFKNFCLRIIPLLNLISFL